MTSPAQQVLMGGLRRDTGLVPTRHIDRRATTQLDDILKAARSEPGILDVSFRDLVGPLPVNDLTHSIYPYPGRLLRQIPRFFLHCKQLISTGDVMLDPFCGSGTTLIEARAAGIDSWGIDCNPFARLLSSVKTTRLSEQVALQALNDVLGSAKRSRRVVRPDVVNIELWHAASTIDALSKLYMQVQAIDVNEELKNYLKLVLALTAERCSLRDQRIPVPVRRKDWRQHAAVQNSATVWSTFSSQGSAVARRLALLSPGRESSVKVFGNSASEADKYFRSAELAELERPRLIITSPPYGAAQKYIRSVSLSLGWTGLATTRELSELEQSLVGREHLRVEDQSDLSSPTAGTRRDIAKIKKIDPVRAAIYAHYFRDMDAALRSSASVLVPKGHLVLVAGSNTVCGVSIDTSEHLRTLAERHGLEQIAALRDTIRGRVLLTKRANATPPLRSEVVHLFRKGANSK